MTPPSRSTCRARAQALALPYKSIEEVVRESVEAIHRRLAALEEERRRTAYARYELILSLCNAPSPATFGRRKTNWRLPASS